MHDLLTTSFLTALISGALVAGVPLLLTGLGETISERAGVLNIGLEGMMLFGAYTGFLGAYYLHSVWAGFLAGAIGGGLLSVIMIVFCVRLGLNQIVIGIAITIAAEGITSVLQGAQFGQSYPRLGDASTISIPLLSHIPILGKSLFTQPPLVYLCFILIGVCAWVFRNTSVGLNLRVAGEKPQALDAAGGSVAATRSWAVLATGMLAGVGGAYLSIVAAGIFVPFMTNGQGYIGIVIAMLARGKPLWVALGAFLFGMALSLSTALQIVGIDISTDVVNMLPFAVVLVAIVIFARRSYLPAALALPYVRGSRG